MKKGDLIACKTSPSERASVNWVVDFEAGITYTSPEVKVGFYNNVDIREWEVVTSAPETYQSSVEQMSVEELRESIDALRGSRVANPARKVRKTMEKSAEEIAEADDPIAKALAKLSPEKLIELKKKMGLL